MKKIDLICDNCGCTFSKELREYNRRIKLQKTKFYCTIQCSAKRPENVQMIINISKPYRFKGGENKLISKEDIIISGLKEFSRRIRRRKDKFVTNISSKELFSIWNAQNGKCAFTKVDLVLPNDQNYKIVNSNYKASIDRINSNLPYTIDNIQFVSITVNMLKQSMTDSQVIEFFDIVRVV